MTSMQFIFSLHLFYEAEDDVRLKLLIHFYFFILNGVLRMLLKRWHTKFQMMQREVRLKPCDVHGLIHKFMVLALPLRLLAWIGLKKIVLRQWVSYTFSMKLQADSFCTYQTYSLISSFFSYIYSRNLDCHNICIFSGLWFQSRASQYVSCSLNFSKRCQHFNK